MYAKHAISPFIVIILHWKGLSANGLATVHAIFPSIWSKKNVKIQKKRIRDCTEKNETDEQNSICQPKILFLYNNNKAPSETLFIK